MRDRLLASDGLISSELAVAQQSAFPKEWAAAQESIDTGDVLLVNGLLYTCILSIREGRPQIMVPMNRRERIIRRANTEGCHLGSQKTYLRIRPYYHWLGMRQDIDLWVEGCAESSLHGLRLRDLAEIPSQPTLSRSFN